MGADFSKEEFDIMLEQLLDENQASFDMLCAIAERTLRPSVRHWCANDSRLRSKHFEDDVMQAIHLRLIQTTKSTFLLRNGVDGPVNNDPEGFRKWIFMVAHNITRSFAKSVGRIDGNETPLEDDENTDIPDKSDDALEIRERNTELLSAAFSIVLDSDSGVYKVLTWIAQCVFMVKLDITKIHSNDLIVKTFENKSLGEMYRMVTEFSRNIPWMVIDEKHQEKIEDQLAKPWDEDRRYYDVKYGEFFMKKGGKATISDWVNRMNNLVRRVMDHEASDG